jgi:hypothetical protein
MAISYAKFIVTVLIAVWNFVVFKLFIFSKIAHQNQLDERTLGDVF